MNRKEMSIRELRQFVELQQALKEAAEVLRQRRQKQQPPQDDETPPAPAPRRWTTITGEDED